MVFLQVRVHLLVSEVRERINPHGIHFHVDRKNGAVPSPSPVSPAQASQKGVIFALDFEKRFDLPHMAAHLLPFGGEIQDPVFFGLFLHAQLRCQCPDGKPVFLSNPVPGLQRFLEHHPGIHEQDGNVEFQSGNHVGDNASRLLHCGQRSEAVPEGFRCPVNQFFGRSIFECLGEFAELLLC